MKNHQVIAEKHLNLSAAQYMKKMWVDVNAKKSLKCVENFQMSKLQQFNETKIFP